MKKSLALPFFVAVLILSSLACTVFVGGPDYSDRTPIPISPDAADSLKQEIQRAFEAGAATGQVTFNITEAQLTSLVAQRLQADPNLQQDSKPLITDPQVYLRDGQMQVFGKTRQGMFAANIGIIISVGIDENGKPKIEIVSADFGPLPAPEGLNGAISAMIEEAYTGAVGPVATGLRIEGISIADGVMTVSGRIK